MTNTTHQTGLDWGNVRLVHCIHYRVMLEQFKQSDTQSLESKSAADTRH